MYTIVHSLLSRLGMAWCVGQYCDNIIIILSPFSGRLFVIVTVVFCH